MATSVPDNASLEQDLVVAQAAVTKQGDTVRSLKACLKEGKANKERQVRPARKPVDLHTGHLNTASPAGPS